MTEQLPSCLLPKNPVLDELVKKLQPHFVDLSGGVIVEELRRIRAENQALQAGYDAARLEITSLANNLNISNKNVRDAEFASECYRKDIESLIAPLGADRYDSKEWREGSRLERIEWLHESYKGAKEQVERLTADVGNLQARDADRHVSYCTALRAVVGLQTRVQELEAMLDAVGAGGVQPLRRAKCLHRIQEPLPTALVPHETPSTTPT